MKYTRLHYEIALTQLQGIGPIRAKEILRKVESPEHFFQMSTTELSTCIGLKRPFILKMDRQKSLEIANDVIQHMHKHDIHAHFYTNTTYPRRLKECSDSPLLIYQKGNVDLNHSKLVSIVGTRQATSYGRQITQELISSFKNLDIIVISGLALGIDTFAHRFCLENNIPTIGVLGHGFDRIYPSKNRQLAKEMLSNGGLVTEFIPGTDPDRENFPKRNRIVAGLTDATIVVESKTKGGSLITAHLANDYNRDVFAYPGGVFTESSTGCNQLIEQQKAHLIQHPSRFLELMGWNEHKSKNIQRSIFPELSEIQNRIVDTLNSLGTLPVDVLSMKSSVGISQLNQELFQLEMAGVIRSTPGKCYTIV